jgi:signal transduction histidine kinase
VRKPDGQQNGQTLGRHYGKIVHSFASAEDRGGEKLDSISGPSTKDGNLSYSSVLEYTKQFEPDVVSVLSHELLFPITLIKGYTATLLHLGDNVTEEQKIQYLKGIESTTNRLAQLLENFRDISRFEIGTMNLLVQPTSLPKLLQKTVSEIQNQTAKHIIKLRLIRPLPRLNIDCLKIEQVMTNLLVNAVKYSPQGGNIEIVARQSRDKELTEVFRETYPIEPAYVIVSVTDSGIGIPNEELELIFQKFHRIDNRVTRATPGAGLGLYICKIITEAHGGQIWATSTAGVGSTFSFALPVEAQ